jgi:DNA-binding GntR family transcriptional regulator
VNIGGGRIDRRTLAVQAADVLRDRILGRELAPGSPLTEMSLAEELGLSRGTIRAGLQRLQLEGLVAQTPYAGWVVAELTARDAWELYTVRAALEGLAAALAASRPEADHVPLQDAFTQLKDACATGDRARISEADLGIHKAIVAMAGNNRLAGHYTLVEQQLRLVIASSNALVPSARDILAQHRPLVRAVLDGDASLAEQLAREHALTQGQVLTDHLQETGGPETALYATEAIRYIPLGG